MGEIFMSQHHDTDLEEQEGAEKGDTAVAVATATASNIKVTASVAAPIYEALDGRKGTHHLPLVNPASV